MQQARCREVPLPSGHAPYALTLDSGGAVWATVLHPPALVSVDPGAALAGDGAGVTVHPLAAGAGRPMQLTAGGDGSLWYTRDDDRLVRRDATGTERVIELPPGAAPYGVCVAPDGTVWFTAPGVDRIGRLTPAGDLRMVRLPVPDSRPAMIAATADGAVWVALNAAGALARLHDGDTGLVRLPHGPSPAAPVGLAAAGDGVFYADIAGARVGHVTAGGTVEQTVFPDAACRPHAVAADPGGGCWVTLWGSGELAGVRAGGTVSHHRLPGREPHGLLVTAGHVWVAMESGSLIAVDRAG